MDSTSPGLPHPMHETIMNTGGIRKPSVPSTKDVEEKPWKYVGYRGYAQFIASDDDFFILRRFKCLNARVALALQDRISELEKRLGELDEAYSRKESGDVNNGSLRDDMEDRTQLLEEITANLNRFNEFLIQQSTLMNSSRAPRRDVKSILRWHGNHDCRAIDADESQYLQHEKDLICLKATDKTPLRQLIDKSRVLRTLSVWEKEKEMPGYDAEYVSYYSNRRMDAFASGTIVLIGAAMLVTPIWILQALESLTMKLAVITVFVLVFLVVLSFAMVAKPFEALGATAAYAAVLMVFLQLGTAD